MWVFSVLGLLKAGSYSLARHVFDWFFGSVLFCIFAFLATFVYPEPWVPKKSSSPG